MGYLKQTVINVSWAGILRASTRIITFIRIIVLARILTPSQFGVFGIASLVLSFLEILTETGINVFLIQEKKAIKYYINDAWLVSILRGILISVFIIGSSPFIIKFFNSADAQRLLLLISVVPLVRGFINPAIVRYQKELLFNKDFFLRLAVFGFDSIVAVILAIVTRDASSFVWGLIAGAFLEVSISFVFIKPTPAISFQKNNIKKIISRGKWVTLFVIFNYIAQEGDNVVVGKILGTGSLGIYQMGYKISTLPISEISDVVNKVIFPVYSKIASDKIRLRKAFLKTMLIVILLVLLLGFLIFLLPNSLMIYVLGANWVDVASILKILVFYGIFRAIVGTTASLFLALGKQNYFATMTFLRLLVLAITIIPLTLLYGIVGASFSALLSVIIELPLTVYLLFLVFGKKSNFK
ncbi:MAG: oligosaccharide flippase family protein [Patescibacteria group bacterium]